MTTFVTREPLTSEGDANIAMYRWRHPDGRTVVARSTIADDPDVMKAIIERVKAGFAKDYPEPGWIYDGMDRVPMHPKV